MTDARQTSLLDSVLISDTLDNSTPIQLEGFGTGYIHLPATVAGNSAFAAYVAPTMDGLYQPAAIPDGTAITITVEDGENYQIPPDLFGAHWIKFVADSADVTASVTLTS